MESNGIKNKIHISESTYNELMAHGKEGYAVAREEKVRWHLFVVGGFSYDKISYHPPANQIYPPLTVNHCFLLVSFSIKRSLQRAKVIFKRTF